MRGPTRNGLVPPYICYVVENGTSGIKKERGKRLNKQKTQMLTHTSNEDS